MEEVLLGLGTAVVGVVGTLSAIWLKHYLERKKAEKDKCIVHQTVKEDVEIISRVEDMIQEVNADRISIFQFHNGGEYYSGKGMQKMTCTYEAVKPGVSRTQMGMQNVPVSACYATLEKLIENKEFHCMDVEANYPESACKYGLLENGVKSTYQYAIFNLDKKAIGMLRADFVLEVEELNESADNALRYFAIKLSGYLVK
tara:strand:- start:55 stop:654 length:600 start_codon:yes stop_codon:yes gene_type:complete